MIIKIFSVLIILLGIVHISFAYPFYSNTDTLWFVGAGMAIIYAGILNMALLHIVISKAVIIIGLIINTFNAIEFCLAFPIINQPQVYIGIVIFLIPAVCFLIKLTSANKRKEP